MNRRKFLQMASMAGVGTPFLLNGMPTRFLNQFLDFNVNCDAVNDRVLVILRMAGANDGLNTVIPVSQYDTYANLRPNIKIANTGTGSYINLDNTVASAKQVGLHPSMTAFKSLYDSGKLTLMNGVGYPNPNYSHFRSENLMFSGKDGSNNQDLFDGIFGRYLGSLYPGLAGNPTTQSPDPLAIQLGNLNPCLFYEHTVEKNIEYNLTGFQTTLFNTLTIPVNSEYNDLLDYIKGVATSMDSYYNRVMQVFNAGNNSTVTYPNSSLGKQLKVVARLIKGGSKTKIFQVNLGGFDTHVNQIQSGSTQLGNHSNLLGDISNSIAAFQTDIEALGIGNKILTVSFSEFGRQVRENASLGTDHGDLAPFFIVGSNISGGIMGDHPVFTNATSYYYNQNQRRYDYRQIFASLMQDWLGADSGLIASAELQSFVTPGTKVNLVKAASVASTVCSTLGTSETKAMQNVKIYPNPAKDYINIEIPNFNKNAEVILFDVSGRKVYSEFKSFLNGKTNIFVGNLTDGNYILNINHDRQISSAKVIVSK
ncbi:hypothetical protein CHRY9390_01932 [Chryseobacterium aquaeductus]|uniref:Secretion system C-terminal sorting domain-containing protein n=1 Tax=Chryseobacterium aquaeductus TaxID=2675056 RepID=A0A9N8MGX9_9FLAO|nr:DUF1501 domain-containing protein [Chryseobacterium aquaeductus]CAA7331245.1 hypothetical protein CHRY9390_01932 [Chryseobacterium potabilaquae]CAD7809048.1 hypothetical protein CHRY9390_01932 [Chryseobacterium aquaeductus]